jgi:hypothetical protein
VLFCVYGRDENAFRKTQSASNQMLDFLLIKILIFGLAKIIQHLKFLFVDIPSNNRTLFTSNFDLRQ